MKRAGVKCVFWGELIEAFNWLIEILLSIIVIALGKDSIDSLSASIWLFTIAESIPFVLFWQSCRVLKANNIHFKKATIFLVIYLASMLFEHMEMQWTWLAFAFISLRSVIEVIIFYHIFLGLSKVAQQSEKALLSTALKRLFAIKLIVLLLVRIAVVTINHIMTIVISSIISAELSQSVRSITAQSLLWVSVLLLYSYILKWLYRAQKELKV
jgi:hypothetical protein